MTVGLSPKALLAFVFPALSTLVLLVVHSLVTGEWNRTETVQAVIGLTSSVLSFIGAWLGNPGVVVKPSANGPTSDSLLEGEARKQVDLEWPEDR